MYSVLTCVLRTIENKGNDTGYLQINIYQMMQMNLKSDSSF